MEAYSRRVASSCSLVVVVHPSMEGPEEDEEEEKAGEGDEDCYPKPFDRGMDEDNVVVIHWACKEKEQVVYQVGSQASMVLGRQRAVVALCKKAGQVVLLTLTGMIPVADQPEEENTHIANQNSSSD